MGIALMPRHAHRVIALEPLCAYRRPSWSNPIRFSERVWLYSSLAHGSNASDALRAAFSPDLC
jgi:hypothetical protein